MTDDEKKTAEEQLLAAALGYHEIRERMTSLEKCGVSMTMPEILALPPKARPKELMEPRRTGKIIVDPPYTDEELLQTGRKSRIGQASLDVELGNAYRKLDRSLIPEGFVIKLSDKMSLEMYDGICPLRELGKKDSIRMVEGSFVRSRTARYYLLPSDLMGLIWGRSKTGRIGLFVHVTAPKIDPGFAGQIVYELAFLQQGPIEQGERTLVLELSPGDVISQMIFLPVGKIGMEYDMIHPGLLARQTSINHAFSPYSGTEVFGSGLDYRDPLVQDMMRLSLQNSANTPWRDAEKL